MHELEQNGLPCKNVNAQSIQQLTALKLQLRSCMLLHPSSQVSYLDSYNRIPVNATNCSIKFVPRYVQFHSDNKLFIITGYPIWAVH